MRQIEITVLSGISTGDRFRYGVDERGVTLGRADDCEVLLQDPTVSRRHAKIFLQGEKLLIADLGSTHGTTHMGFQLLAGEENARVISPEEEFKVGSALFRISFEESSELPQTNENTPAKRSVLSQLPTSLQAFLKVKRNRLILGAVTVGLVALLLVPEEKSGLPPQQSEVTLSLPQEKLIGFLSVGKGRSDKTRADKAIFSLPVSDSVIEYEYMAEAPLRVMVDQSTVAEVPPNTESWLKRVILSRDVVGGQDRKLVFDSLGWPQPKDAPKQGNGKPKNWGLNYVVVAPVMGVSEANFIASLDAAVAEAEKLGRSPKSFYELLRQLQRAILAGMKDANLDAFDYPVALEKELPDSQLLVNELQGIISDRRSGLSTVTISTHLKTLGRIASGIDSELWRKANLTLRQAERSSKYKDYIEAHDMLISAQAFFPEGEDYRWLLLDRMLNDKKVIPTKIRKNPAKFRRKG